VRRIVTFRSAAFNTRETKPYFINPGCFGDDVARWLIAELCKRSVDADKEPGQEDFGWYLDFRFASVRYLFVVGLRPDDELEGRSWILWIERNRGLFGSAFGGRGRGIDPAVPQLLHQILTASPQIEDVRWYSSDEFDRGNEKLYEAGP
jgi:hypothetical protein